MGVYRWGMYYQRVTLARAIYFTNSQQTRFPTSSFDYNLLPQSLLLSAYIMSTSRSPYKLPRGERDADEVTYNPMADDRVDNDEFDPEDTERQTIGARGADNEPTRRHFSKEDTETARSDATGRIPKGEVAELVSSAGEGNSGQNLSGTRGIRVDAWKQDKEMDKMYVESGLADAVQDVEIKRGTGYSQ